MEIVEIYKDCLYSIKFEEETTSEFNRLLKQWNDIDNLIDFFSMNREYIDTPFWKMAGLSPEIPETSAQKVANEARDLGNHLKALFQNSRAGLHPDFDDYFHNLDGKYKFMWVLEPVKSYGTETPSLLRLYAIRLRRNCYLFVCGGIKLCGTIQDSPTLKDHVFKRIDYVLAFLKENGIVDETDF